MARVSQIGIVRQAKRGKVEVEITRSTSCGEKCSSCNAGCSGTGIIVQLENSVNARVGDIVRIEAAGGNIIGSAVFVYLLPIIMMVMGMVYGSKLAQMIYPGADADFLGLVFGLTALVLFYFLLRLAGQRLALTGKNKPRIVDIINR